MEGCLHWLASSLEHCTVPAGVDFSRDKTCTGLNCKGFVYRSRWVRYSNVTLLITIGGGLKTARKVDEINPGNSF